MVEDAAGAVFVQTNEPQNRVVAFRRASDGSLARGARAALALAIIRANLAHEAVADGMAHEAPPRQSTR